MSAYQRVLYNYNYNLEYIELHPSGMDQATLHLLFIFAWVVCKHLLSDVKVFLAGRRRKGHFGDLKSV